MLTDGIWLKFCTCIRLLAKVFAVVAMALETQTFAILFPPFQRPPIPGPPFRGIEIRHSDLCADHVRVDGGAAAARRLRHVGGRWRGHFDRRRQCPVVENSKRHHFCAWNCVLSLVKLVTLNHTERRNGQYFPLFQWIRYLWSPIT